MPDFETIKETIKENGITSNILKQLGELYYKKFPKEKNRKLFKLFNHDNHRIADYLKSEKDYSYSEKDCCDDLVLVLQKTKPRSSWLNRKAEELLSIHLGVFFVSNRYLSLNTMAKFYEKAIEKKYQKKHSKFSMCEFKKNESLNVFFSYEDNQDKTKSPPIKIPKSEKKEYSFKKLASIPYLNLGNDTDKEVFTIDEESEIEEHESSTRDDDFGFKME